MTLGAWSGQLAARQRFLSFKHPHGTGHASQRSEVGVHFLYDILNLYFPYPKMESWKNHECMVCTAIVIGQHHPDWLRCCDLCAAVCWCKRAQPNRVPNISKYWFHWQVFESVPHVLSTYMYGCCTVSTLNLREGEIRRTAVFALHVPMSH